MRLVGSNALLLEVADVAAWTAELTRRRGREFTAEEIVPGARTVLIDGVADPAALAALIEGWPEPPPAPASDGRLVEIPTIYDGPDLADVAALWDSTIDDVIAVHGGTEFRVAFFGFAPGFAYLTGLPRAVPRRDTPRTRVPAGSVGLADAYSAIYPSASPGGWQLIGRTAEVLFDVERQPPARLAPGDRVRFTNA
ncbi:MAG TPA: allophanate hydrolase subunit 1 [Micromonosporaceae bacterium]